MACLMIHTILDPLTGSIPTVIQNTWSPHFENHAANRTLDDFYLHPPHNLIPPTAAERNNGEPSHTFSPLETSSIPSAHLSSFLATPNILLHTAPQLLSATTSTPAPPTCPTDLSSADYPICEHNDCLGLPSLFPSPPPSPLTCTTGPLANCPCKHWECPDLALYNLFCSDCGGKAEDGRCRGHEDENWVFRGCDCLEECPPDLEPRRKDEEASRRREERVRKKREAREGGSSGREVGSV